MNKITDPPNIFEPKIFLYTSYQ